MIALVLGGARSGRAATPRTWPGADARPPSCSPRRAPLDADHGARIARHKAERGPEWTTIEEPSGIARADLAGRVVVVDCVTLWLTNLFADAKWNATRRSRPRAASSNGLTAIDATWIFVSNELGMAPHAEHAVTRKFVDAAGFLNQDIARRASRVVLMAAGLPLTVKGPTCGRCAEAR